MQEFVIYLFKMIICSGVLFLYYFLFLRDKPIHQYNRYFLLCSVIAGLFLPLVTITLPWHDAGSQPPLYLQTLNAIHIGISNNANITTGDIFSGNISMYLISLYAAVTLVIFTRLLLSIYKVMRLRRRHRPVIIGNIYLYNTGEKKAPFSFMNNIFWSRSINIHSGKGEQILRHEMYHVQQKHSLDLVFVEIVIAMVWINPFLYLVKKELSTVHEYLADEFAISGDKQQEYAELLVSNAIAQKQYGHITHSFFHSQLKRRIAMILHNSAATGNTRIRKIMGIPLFLILFCCLAFKAELSSSNQTAGSVIVKSQDTMKEASFKGGAEEWSKFLVKNMKYPKPAQEQKKQGNVVVTFIVNTDGSVSGEAVVNDPGFGLGEEALRVIRLSSGQWNPATENGSAVKSQKSQPFVFRL